MRTRPHTQHAATCPLPMKSNLDLDLDENIFSILPSTGIAPEDTRWAYYGERHPPPQGRTTRPGARRTLSGRRESRLAARSPAPLCFKNIHLSAPWQPNPPFNLQQCLPFGPPTHPTPTCNRRSSAREVSANDEEPDGGSRHRYVGW